MQEQLPRTCFVTRPPRQLRPSNRHWGSRLARTCFMLRQVALALHALATLVHPCTSTRKNRSDMLAQKANESDPG
jgi:hypothetical protein